MLTYVHKCSTICIQIYIYIYRDIIYYIYIMQIDIIWMHIFLADAHQLYVVPRCYGSVGVFSCGSYGTLVALALEGLESRQRCEHVEMMMWVNHFAFTFWVVKFLQISVHNSCLCYVFFLCRVFQWICSFKWGSKVQDLVIPSCPNGGFHSHGTLLNHH